MTNEELAILAQNGNKEAESTLIEKNKNFVYRIAAKHSYLKLEFDDIVSASYYGMYKSIKTFNPDKGRFTTWAGFYMHRQILNLFGRKKQVPTVPLEGFFLDKDGEEQKLIDIIQVEENEDWTSIKDIVNRALREETVRNKQIFNLYMDGMKQIEIAKMYQISQVQISRLINKMMDNIKAEAVRV